MIKERPMIFSAPMVQAILAGKKTQTRRIANVTDNGCKPGMITPKLGFSPRSIANHAPYCPYGVAGDRIWVRESAQQPDGADNLNWQFAVYSADGAFVRDDEGFAVFWWYSRPKCPSIHLPRRFSRILLEITAVRVERLHDISDADTFAEGIGIDCHSHPDDTCASYKTLWEKINGTASWNSNPWVWVIEFKRV